MTTINQISISGNNLNIFYKGGNPGPTLTYNCDTTTATCVKASDGKGAYPSESECLKNCKGSTPPSGYKYPYPAIVGYWGTQAASLSARSQQCINELSLVKAVNNGYNVIILTFAQIGGSCIKTPNTKDPTDLDALCIDLGGVVFPTTTLFTQTDAPTLQFYKDSFAKLNNNPKKPIVLLSFGGITISPKIERFRSLVQ